MKLIKWIFIGGFGLFIILAILGKSSSSKNDALLFKGESIDREWDTRSICQTARAVIKDSLPKQKVKPLYSLACTVTKLTSPLPAVFDHYDPYAVTWPNGIAARVFITSSGGLKVSGISKKGIPFDWNNDHKPIAKNKDDFAQDCSKLFVSKVNAKDVKIVNVEKYDDLSGASVELTYVDSSQVNTKGDCLFDRTKMTSASSKIESDKYYKNVYTY
jgi:hypothetical protein